MSYSAENRYNQDVIQSTPPTTNGANSTTNSAASSASPLLEPPAQAWKYYTQSVKSDTSLGQAREVAIAAFRQGFTEGLSSDHLRAIVKQIVAASPEFQKGTDKVLQSNVAGSGG